MHFGHPPLIFFCFCFCFFDTRSHYVISLSWNLLCSLGWSIFVLTSWVLALHHHYIILPISLSAGYLTQASCMPVNINNWTTSLASAIREFNCSCFLPLFRLLITGHSRIDYLFCTLFKKLLLISRKSTSWICGRSFRSLTRTWIVVLKWFIKWKEKRRNRGVVEIGGKGCR